MTDITVRKAEPADIPFIIDLHAAEHVQRFLGAPTEAELHRAFSRPNVNQWIATIGSAPAALIVMDAVHDWLCEIRRLAVLRPGLGIEAQAMRWAVQHAFARTSVNRIYLEVSAENAIARRLYEGLNFVHEGTFRLGYLNTATGKFEDLCAYGLLRSDQAAGVQ